MIQSELPAVLKNQFEAAMRIVLSDPAQAEIILRDLLATTSISTRDRLHILNLLGYALYSQEKLEDSLQYYNEVLQIAENEQFIEEKADALTGIARLNSDLDNYSKIEEQCKAALTLYKSLNLPNKEADPSNILAVSYYVQGLLDDAIYWFDHAISIATDTHTIQYVKILNNTGLVYRARGDLEKSAEYFQKSLSIAEEMEFSLVACTSHNNLADTLCFMGEYPAARRHYAAGLRIAIEKKDRKNIALLSGSFANYWIQKGDLKRAYGLLKTALKIYEEINDSLGKILALYNFGQYWIMKGQLKRAKRILYTALEVINTSHVTESQIEVLVLLAEVCEGLNEIDEAYKYLIQADDIGRERRSELAHTFVLIQRGLIQVNKVQFHEAEMILKEALYLAQKLNHFELQFKAQMLLARNFFIRYVRNPETKAWYDLAIQYISEAMVLVKNKKLLPYYINTLIIRGMLYSIQEDPEKAQLLLAEAFQLANEHGMTLQARSAKERLSLIIGGQSSQSAQLSFKNIVLSLAMDELKKATTSYVESTITEEDLAHTFMVSFRLDESIGPTIHAVEQIDLSDDSQYRLLTQISILYSVALGQGQGYHEGLFGPLPYGSELRSIIFTCSMQDPTASRQKYKKQAYMLFCLVFPQKMVPFFYDRQKLNRIFEVHTKSLNKVSDITTGFLTNLRQTILMEFQHDFRSEEFDDTGISDEL